MWPRHLYDILHHTHCSLGTLEQRFSNKQRPCTPWSCKFHPVRWRQVHTVTVNMHLLRPSDLQKQHGGPMLDTYFSGLRALKEHRSSMVDTYLFQVPAYGNFPGTRTKRVHGPTGICIYNIFFTNLRIQLLCVWKFTAIQKLYTISLFKKYISETNHAKSIYNTCWPSSMPHLRGLSRYMDVPCNTKVDILVTWRCDGTDKMTSSSMKRANFSLI